MITDLTRRAQFDISSSVPSSFAFTFWFYSAAEFVAVVTLADGTDQTLVNGVDYSITDPGAGGTFTRLSTWPATAQTLTLYRLTAMTQETDFRNGDNSDAETLETTLDRMVAMLQENADLAVHAIIHPLTDPIGLNLAVPAVALRANRYLAWDSAGNVMAVDGVAASGTANAAQLDGYHAGHALGTIPIADGVECIGLVAEQATTAMRADNMLGVTNIRMGTGSLASITTGYNNIAIGISALLANTEGGYNIAIGTDALADNIYGGANTAIGAGALGGNINGNSNTAIGISALNENTNGDFNTAIGRDALHGSTTGSNNTAIGYLAQTAAPGSNNSVTLGNSSIISLRCNVTSISALSDRRDKADIEDIPVGLDFLNDLRPRSWRWDRREWYENGVSDGTKKKETSDYGFVAQELQDIQREFGVDLHLVLEDNPEKLEAAPGYLLPVIVRAIQELSAKVSALEEKVNAQ